MNDAQTQLTELAAQVRGCQNCALGRVRTHAVAGEGPANAEIMFIGEGPGFEEDRQGRPFVGPSGQLLETLLARIGLSRQQVFIANVIKCRPPNNRDPLPGEITACAPYLDRQIELIDPLVIVTLGRFSMARFFPPTARITRMHGQPLRQEGRAILPLFHPAAVLRNPDWQRAMEEDFGRIPTLLEEMLRARAALNAPPEPDLEQLSLF